jgi:hypothetical protein
MITFVTCWYALKNKFNKSIYEKWISNFLTNVNNFYLVIYTDNHSVSMLYKYIDNNPRIKVVLLPIHKFYNIKYQDKWIKNQKNNIYLKQIEWKVNMLWCEKISFVKKTIEKNYFNTDWYGWCDIGYFRCDENAMTKQQLTGWPNHKAINQLNKTKIHYANICNNVNLFRDYKNIVGAKNQFGLPTIPIPPVQMSIAGGFFLIYKDKINWWHKTFDERLQLYFKHNYLVKDDQMIILDCALTAENEFQLYFENDNKYDNWFMFQRKLL